MSNLHESWVPIIEDEELSDGSTIYVAFHPELIGIRAQASTSEVAMEIFKENLEDYFQYLSENKIARPTATHIKIDGIEWFQQKGQIPMNAHTVAHSDMKINCVA